MKPASKGDFYAQARRRSLYTWGKTLTAVSATLAGAVLGGAFPAWGRRSY